MSFIVCLMRYVFRYFEEIIGFTVFVGIFVAQSLQIFFRYVLNNPLSGTDEISRILFIWLGFIGAAIVTKHNAHLSTEFITSLLPASIRRIVEWIIRLLLVGFLVVIVKEGTKLVLLTKGIEIPILNISVAIRYLPIPFFGFLVLVRMLIESRFISLSSLIKYFRK